MLSADRRKAKGKATEFIAQDAGVGSATVERFKYIEKKAPNLADDLCSGKEDRKKIIARQANKRMKAGKKIGPALISGQGSQNKRSGRTDHQISKITGIGHDTVSKFNYIQKHAEDFDAGDLIRQMCEETVDDEIKHRCNLSDQAKIKGVLLLEGFYKEKAKENQGTRTDLSSELKTGSRETDQEKRARRNANCVNAQLADIAGVSTAKVFRYKEILEHGTPEEIEAVESGET